MAGDVVRGSLRLVLTGILLVLMTGFGGEEALGKSLFETISELKNERHKLPTPPASGFTISSIEPNLKQKRLEITFNRKCDRDQLRDTLKVFPPTRLHWYSSRVRQNVLSLSGNFKPGQQYTIGIPGSLECGGETYTPTVTRTRMPDIEPAIKFAERGSVIERDSREMLHTSLVNIDELTYRGLHVSPLLIPGLLNGNFKYTFADFRKQLNGKTEALEKLATDHGELQPFLAPKTLDQQLFFPGGEANKWGTYSLPLGFRQEARKGAVTVVSLMGKGLGKTVESPRRVFRLTDIGLTYKLSEQGLLVWATSLHSGQPLAGLSLALVGEKGSFILGRTDRDGLLVVPDGEPRKKVILQGEGRAVMEPLDLKQGLFLAAASTSDQTYLSLERQGNIKADWLNQSRTVSNNGRLLRGHLFTERGIYRPGETLNFKGTLRELLQGDVAPPKEVTPRFTIVNSKGEQIYKKEIALSEFGTASDQFFLKPFFPLGTYTVHMGFGPGSQDRVSRTFQVQEFRPPRHFTEIGFASESKKDSTYINLDRETALLRADVRGKYYAGGPVKHGKVRWKVYYTSSSYPQKTYPEYSFGNYIEKKSALLESGESILDEKGALSVTLPMGKEVAAGVYGVEVVATVVDFDGRASSETAVFQRRPDYLVGIRSHPDSIEAGDPQNLDLLVLDPEGMPIGSGQLSVEVMRKSHYYVKKRNDQGNVYWSWEETWRREIASTLAVDEGKARFDFDFAWGGSYLLKFTYEGKDGRRFTSSTAYQVNGSWYGWEYENRGRSFEKFTIQPEKSEYRPGETLRLLLHPHRPLAKVLLTMEREGIIEYRVIDVKPGQKYLNLPITAAHVPNVYVSVLGVVPRGEFPVYAGEFDDQAPTFLFGAVNIEVRTQTEKLQLSINAGDTQIKALPGSEVTLSLQVKGAEGTGVESELAIGVVDESVLALTGYSTPTLEGLNRFIGPLSVYTGDLRAELLKQTPFGKVGNEPVTGGDGIGKSPDAPTSKVRKDFRPVAYFNPAVRTDADGRATVSFDVPDTMTTYRVYAVACDKSSRFASKQRDLLVVKDFYLEPGLPRFFTRGDRFRFAVSAFNKTDRGDMGTFSLIDDDHVALKAGIEEFSLSAYDRILLPVSGEAKKPGTAKLRFEGAFSGLADGTELKVPVNSGHLLWNDLQYGTFRGGGPVSYTFPEGTEKMPWSQMGPDEVQAQLTVSGSPFLRMGKGLRYLLRYPYGCVEQTSSRVLPLAALRGLVQEGLIPGISVEETDKFLKKGVDRLFSMQTSSGGFGYWPGNLKPHQWGSIYATTALTHARRSGLEIPEKRMDRAMDYLQKEIGEAGQGVRTVHGFAAYILALNGRLERKQFDQLFDLVNGFSRQGALLLMLAGSESGYLPKEALAKATAKFLDRRWEWRGDDIFYARYREPAIALIAAATILPDGPQAGRLAQQLLGGINKQGIWTSTSDTGWSLVALGEYFRGRSFADRPVEVKLQQKGLPEQTVSVDPKGFASFALDAKAFLSDPQLTLESDSDRDVAYQLSLTFPRLDLAESGYANGFRIDKRIENTDGSKKIKVGDVVKVTLDIEVADSSFRYVVVDDPLPAGLVAINSALKTEEAVPETKVANEDDGWWNYWDYEGGFYRFVPNFFEIRDDRVLVFKDRAWRGVYQYSYYARAVAAGEFVLPATKIQLMYEPGTVSYSPVSQVDIEER